MPSGRRVTSVGSPSGIVHGFLRRGDDRVRVYVRNEHCVGGANGLGLLGAVGGLVCMLDRRVVLAFDAVLVRDERAGIRAEAGDRFRQLPVVDEVEG